MMKNSMCLGLCLTGILGLVSNSYSHPHVLSSRASFYRLLGGAKDMECASRHYQRGSKVLVWNATGGKHTRKWLLTVTDAGPYVSGREFDLSPEAFERVFGSTSKGVCKISYRVIKQVGRLRE